MSLRLLSAYAELFLLRLRGDEATAERATIEVAALEDSPEAAPLAAIARGLELDRPGLLLLLLLAAADRDPRLLAAARALHNDPLRASLDPGTAAIALGASVGAALDATATLRRLDLLMPRRNDLGLRAFTPLVPVPRIVDALIGDQHLPDELAGIVDLLSAQPDNSDPTRIDLRQLVVPTAAADTLRTLLARRSDPAPVVILQGVEGTGKRSLTRAIAAELGLATLVVHALELPHDREALQPIVAAILREARLRDAVVLLDSADAIAEPRRCQVVGGALAALHRPPVLSTTGGAVECVPRGRAMIRLDLPLPDPAGRERLWGRHLDGRATAEELRTLAIRYPVAPGLIARASSAARLVAGDGPVSPDDLKTAIGDELAERFRGIGTRIDKHERWQDLVLPPETQDAITELVSRVRHRRRVVEEWGFGGKLAKGLGLSVLFSGEPGTGKTMVASLIAEELGLQLYQIDLSTLVSKYIGETEKNLARAFDAAEAGHAVLLFDEADALFGKRSSDVKSATDRYANMETNYLLQRIERFSGVAILTTNLQSAIDPAFQRRLSVHVRFEMPDEDARAELWRRMLPAAAPRADGIDFRALGRSYKFSGGYIRNAVLRAAYLAAAEATPITLVHLRRAADLEAWEMGRVAGASAGPAKPR